MDTAVLGQQRQRRWHGCCRAKCQQLHYTLDYISKEMPESRIHLLAVWICFLVLHAERRQIFCELRKKQKGQISINEGK